MNELKLWIGLQPNGCALHGQQNDANILHVIRPRSKPDGRLGRGGQSLASRIVLTFVLASRQS